MKTYTISFDATWIVLVAENLQEVLKLLRTKEDNYFIDSSNKLRYMWEYEEDYPYDEDEEESVYCDVEITEELYKGRRELLKKFRYIELSDYNFEPI